MNTIPDRINAMPPVDRIILWALEWWQTEPLEEFEASERGARNGIAFACNRWCKGQCSDWPIAEESLDWHKRVCSGELARPTKGPLVELLRACEAYYREPRVTTPTEDPAEGTGDGSVSAITLKNRLDPDNPCNANDWARLICWRAHIVQPIGAVTRSGLIYVRESYLERFEAVAKKVIDSK